NNISFISDHYYEVLNNHSKYVLIQLNLKNFKYFNTKYGYKAGNEILFLIFQTLKTFIKEDEYVSYLYSDNFVLLLQYEDLNDFLYVRIAELVDQLYRIDDQRVYRCLFFSIGIYEIDEPNVSFEDALNLANLARRESESIKQRNHSIELYDKAFYHQYMDRLELEMKTADAYKEYEFSAFLQPKVDLETEQIVGAEALLRWIDKDGNNIPLYQFLPILNQNSYIELVDLDVFDQICSKLDERLRQNKKVVPVSFNISKSSFYSSDILKDYLDIFEKYDIPKQLIEIEFMESISLDDTERMKRIVSGFKDYGFSCSLDDFGNGYSSFNVLLNAPFDIIKMDRQFFLDNLKGDNQLIIKTVVDLIHSLGMKVVAEGVELKEHVDYLKACQCNYVQGFYYYKPMPIQDFENLLDKQ
ncbi:MAG: GGDEF domain-containing phosphodiesterase, partial [Coprobacillus sp.]